MHIIYFIFFLTEIIRANRTYSAEQCLEQLTWSAAGDLRDQRKWPSMMAKTEKLLFERTDKVFNNIFFIFVVFLQSGCKNSKRQPQFLLIHARVWFELSWIGSGVVCPQTDADWDHWVQIRRCEVPLLVSSANGMASNFWGRWITW